MLADRGDATRAALGTDGCVFLWVGASAFLQPACVLFLDPILDEDVPKTLVAPWDTKGLLGFKVLGRTVTLEEASRVVDEHSLPPPLYREFLAEVLHLCYEHPSAYLHGEVPNRCYPGRLGISYTYSDQRGQQDMAPAHTFEARIPGELPLKDQVIGMVIDPAELWDERSISKKLEALRAWCRRKDILFRDLRPGLVLRDLVIEVAETLLRDRGAL